MVELRDPERYARSSTPRRTRPPSAAPSTMQLAGIRTEGGATPRRKAHD
jgi:hypothetical protein